MHFKLGQISGVLILISNKTEFIVRHIKWEKQEYFIYFIFIKEIIYQEHITAFNLKTPYNKILKKQKILPIEEEIDKSTVIVRNFNNNIYQKLTSKVEDSDLSIN